MRIIVYVVFMILAGVVFYFLNQRQLKKHGFYCWKCRRWRPNGPIFGDDAALYLREGCPKCHTMPVEVRRCPRCNGFTLYPDSPQTFDRARRCIRWWCGYKGGQLT